MSLYLPNDQPIDNHLERVERVVRRYERAVVCEDANSWHTVWGSWETKSRGQRVLDVLGGVGLSVVNSPSELPTFVGPRGSGWIDVTFATAQAARSLADWRVSPDTSSDHNAIEFALGGDPGMTEEPNFKGYARTADWPGFVAALEGVMEEEEWHPEINDVEEEVGDLSDAI